MLTLTLFLAVVLVLFIAGQAIADRLADTSPVFRLIMGAVGIAAFCLLGFAATVDVVQWARDRAPLEGAALGTYCAEHDPELLTLQCADPLLTDDAALVAFYLYGNPEPDPELSGLSDDELLSLAGAEQ